MKKTSAFVTILVVLSSCSSEPDQPKDQIFNVNGIALNGYDPVAYFVQGEAEIGVDEEKVNHQGVTYLFSSTKNRLLFQENPHKYLPKYGGWCAYAVAESATKMEPDPALWQIKDGELQLFYDDWMTNLTGNLKEAWNEDPTQYKIKADANWDRMNP